MFHVAFRLGLIRFGTHESHYVVQVVAADDGHEEVDIDMTPPKETVSCVVNQTVSCVVVLVKGECCGLV